MLDQKRNPLSIFLLVSCWCVLFPAEVFADAFERGKGKKYTDYGLTLDSGYNTAFHYQDDERNQTIFFKDETKKLIFSIYKERGLSDRFTYVSKLSIQRIMSKLDVHVKEEQVENNSADFSKLNHEDAQYIKDTVQTESPEKIPLKDFKANMNFVGIEYELGIRALLHKGQNQSISVDAIVGLPPAAYGEGGASIFQPSLKVGLSYAKTFDLKKKS